MGVARKRSEILIGKALREAAIMTLDRYVMTGGAVVPDIAGRQVALALARCWNASVKGAVATVQRDLAALDAKADIWEQFALEYARLYGAQAVADILETTRRQIVDAVARGLQDGKGIEIIAKEIRETIPGISRLRSAIIARTEAHGAAQYASIETAKRYPFPVVKIWNSTSDHRTRDFGEGDGKIDQANHRRMNGVIAPLADPFMVPNKWGGFDPMMFPGDPAGPAYQCVNCRCAMSYKRAARVN